MQNEKNSPKNETSAAQMKTNGAFVLKVVNAEKTENNKKQSTQSINSQPGIRRQLKKYIKNKLKRT